MSRYITLVLLLCSSIAIGQHNIRESVYSHLSASELLVGETLYFNNYVFSEHTGQLSRLSRILYVELLNPSGKPVYQSKLLLDEGQESGSYFIPTDLETGNYHFVAYTRWMKNFDDFFHQSVTIINPYVSQKFIAKPEPKMKTHIAIEGGRLLAHAKNKVVLRVTNQFEQGIQTKGKIVSQDGNDPIEVVTDEFGFFSFFITPEAGESYQLILENGEGFEFIDLPAPCSDCSLFRVIDIGSSFTVKMASGDLEKPRQGQLDIFKNQELVYSKAIVVNAGNIVSKNELPEGLLRVIFTESQRATRERLVWNGKIAAPSKLLGTYNSMSEVKVNFQIPDSADLSVSIEQVNEKGAGLSMEWSAEIGAKIDQKLPYDFYQTANQEQLDHALIASKYIAAKKNPMQVKYLPEFRSGIVQGQVTNKANQPMANVPVGLAFSGSQPQISAAPTDSAGRFVLTYNPQFTEGEPTVERLDEVTDANILIEPEFYASYSGFMNQPIVFDSAKVASIVERSINNQIANAYYQAQDMRQTKEMIPQFYGVRTYVLDDFTRFATIRDTFIELIAEVGVSKNENKYEFKMRSQDMTNHFLAEYPTLILLDGAFVTQEDLMNLSPYLVERIDVLNQRYYFGKIIIDGILLVSTFANDRGEIKPKGTKVDLVAVQPKLKSPIIEINPSQNVREPYYQDLIYWNPSINHTGKSLNLQFSTSEVKGLFEIKIEGLSTSGKPISRRAYFQVK